jgi:hypothetical protein
MPRAPKEIRRWSPFSVGTMFMHQRGRQVLWLAGAFLLCFVAGGFVEWRGSYQEYLQAGFHLATIAPLFVGVAMALTWLVGCAIVPSALAVGVAFPAIILVRVLLDGIRNPTAHNLWPVELVMAFVLGIIMALPAAATGGLLRRITHRRRNDTRRQ